MIQDTSVEALVQLIPKLGERQREVLYVLRANKDMTNSEIGSILGRPINTITPRVFELREAGLVMESRKRTCGITGRNAIAWKVKDVH